MVQYNACHVKTRHRHLFPLLLLRESGPYSEGGRRVTEVEPPQKSQHKIFVFHVDVYFRSAGAGVLSSLMTMTVGLIDAILAGFSVEMILIAQTVFMLIFVVPLLMS